MTVSVNDFNNSLHREEFMLIDASLRLVVFLTALGVLCLWETFFPKRVLIVDKWLRWRRNFSLITLSSIISFIILPFTAVSTAWLAQSQQIGLFYWLNLPTELSFLLAILLLDLFIYAQHVAFHHLPFFWRFHQVHHMDQDIDVSTGIRFHPVEILFSICLKAAAILCLGAPVMAVIVFELVLNVMALFSHSNLALSAKLDKYLRWLLVTPDMHRVHHSSIQQEEQSNFGFNIACWDRLFRTYQAQPKLGHQAMDIGIPEFHDPKKARLWDSLLTPFYSKK